MAPDHFGSGRSGHRGLACADRSHKRTLETAELPRGLCVNSKASDPSPEVVGPPPRWLAQRWTPQQCLGSQAALCQHRRTGGLG